LIQSAPLSEIVSDSELKTLLEQCPNPVAYDGFEPSGRMHIAQGLLKKVIVDRFCKAGFTFIFWVADWFALLNHKMGGDIEKIKMVGKYFIEVWKAAGMPMERVRFLWASEEIAKYNDEYWSIVFDIATSNSVPRITRCTQIMGRNDENLSASQIFYPCMQATDVFFLGVDVCQLGEDQRKVNVLAREHANKQHLQPPIIASHVMMPGLLEGQEKMSKSTPDSAIFLEDSPEEVIRKIKRAFCPPGVIAGNPCVAYLRYIVFELVHGPVVFSRPEKYGGDLSVYSYQQFEKEYVSGNIHPSDLKMALSTYINQLLDPVRDHFLNNINACKLKEIVQSFAVTR
jgi:tyrosyl-tRNA synthetase